MIKKLGLVLCVILALSLSSYAYSMETATVHAHYSHPVSGMIEDAGNNPGIGQGMVENVTHTSALFEEIHGQLYAGIRMNMANYISNVSFAVQDKGEGDFYALNYQVVREREETIDYRFIVPSKDAVVRVSCYIGPMSRDVIYYLDFSDFISGNSDFVALGESGAIEKLVESSFGDQSAKIEVQGVNDLMSAGQLGYSHGLLVKDSPQIKAVFNIVDEGADNLEAAQADDSMARQSDAQPWGPFTKIAVASAMLLLVLMTVFFAVSAIVLFWLARYLKARNDREQEALYEEI